MQQTRVGAAVDWHSAETSHGGLFAFGPFVATIVENRERWQQHRWAQQGDEWSPGRSTAGTALLWHRSIFPRIQQLLPADTILEIGPGFGRWTQFLRRHCSRLVLVDLSARCIESCRTRFAADFRIEYILNDGTSLDRVADRSVDFIFSFDSLVHAEADVIGAYLAQAARKLKPGGTGFIHHSNLHAFVHPRTHRLRWFVTRPNWRAESMSADVFRQLCHSAGLSCRSQELINWFGKARDADRYRLNGRCIPLTDCFSIVATPEAGSRSAERVVNPTFVDEWRQAVWMSRIYCSDSAGAGTLAHAMVKEPRERPRAWLQKCRTARDVQRSRGWSAVTALVWRRLGRLAERAAAFVKAHVVGLANRWFLKRSGLRGESLLR